MNAVRPLAAGPPAVGQVVVGPRSVARLRAAGVLAAALCCLALPFTDVRADQATMTPAATLLEDARRLADTGEVPRAAELALRARDRARDAGNAPLQGQALQLRASLLERLNRYDEAEQALREALVILEPLGAGGALADVQEEMSKLYGLRGDYATSLVWARRARRTAEQGHDAAGLVSVYTRLGVLYGDLGHLDLSLDWHQRALAMAREAGDEAGIANGLYAMGDAYQTLHEHDKALRFFRDVLAMDQASGVRNNIAFSHMKVGYTSMALGRFAEAREHLLAARDLFRQMASPRDEHWALVNLAELTLAEGGAEEAHEALSGFLERASREGWPKVVRMARFGLARADQRLERWDEAVAHLDAALQDALAQASMRDARRVYELQAEVYAAAGRTDDALATLQASIALERELFDDRRASIIAAMEGEAEFERQAAALQLAEQEQALARLALQRSQMWRWIGFGVLGVLFLLALLLHGRVEARRRQRLLREQVAEQTRVLREQHRELEQAYAAVNRASLTDPLTGLANRRFLEQHLPADAARARALHRQAQESGVVATSADLVVFLLDLDHFKSVNDRFGHEAGDAVLMEVSRRLQEEFREGDFVARWGGEEFLAVARFVDRRKAAAIAERVRAAIHEQPVAVSDDLQIECTCSIGFSSFPPNPSRPDAGRWQDVVGLADQALYEVKRERRNGWLGYVVAREIPASGPVAEWVPLARESGALETVSSVASGR